LIFFIVKKTKKKKRTKSQICPPHSFLLFIYQVVIHSHSSICPLGQYLTGLFCNCLFNKPILFKICDSLSICFTIKQHSQSCERGEAKKCDDLLVDKDINNEKTKRRFIWSHDYYHIHIKYQLNQVV
jgi:hypothetical protein